MWYKILLSFLHFCSKTFIFMISWSCKYATSIFGSVIGTSRWLWWVFYFFFLFYFFLNKLIMQICHLQIEMRNISAYLVFLVENRNSKRVHNFSKRLGPSFYVVFVLLFDFKSKVYNLWSWCSLFLLIELSLQKQQWTFEEKRNKIREKLQKFSKAAG